MPRIKLTARGIESLNCLEGQNRTEWFDIGLPGFHVRVTSKGARSYGVLYRHHGRRRRLTLGATSKLPLADARTLAKESLRLSEAGIHPVATKKEARTAETVGELVEQYLERWAKPNKKTWREDERIINNKLIPVLGRVTAKDVTRAEVRSLLDRIAAGSLPGQRKAAPIEANRTLALLRKIFNWGVEQDLVPSNPVLGVKRVARERQRDRVLNADEIRLLWAQLELERANIAAIFKLLLLTAQRKSEVLSMRWLDLHRELWTISAERSKNGLPHRVPLSIQARSILDDVQTRNEWLFPSSSATGHIKSIQKAVERIRERCGLIFRVHDLRRTAASHLASVGVQRLTISKILNHVEKGVTRVYDRHSYDHEKQRALQLWGSRVEELLAGRPSGILTFPLVRDASHNDNETSSNASASQHLQL